MNCNPKRWNRILLSHKLVELRVVVKGLRFVGAKKNVGVPGTAGTAWRHVGYREAPD